MHFFTGNILLILTTFLQKHLGTHEKLIQVTDFDLLPFLGKNRRPKVFQNIYDFSTHKKHLSGPSAQICSENFQNIPDAVIRTVFWKNSFLKNFAKFPRKDLCRSLLLNKVLDGACNFIKETPVAASDFLWKIFATYCNEIFVML